jgi:dTDP-4-dehydrorhamnose reductase
MGTVTFDKKKRYVVLEGVTFTVYKDQKEIDKPVQTIDLAEFAVQVDEKEKKKWQFDIIHLKNKKDVHQFKLENDKELNTWLTAIESVCVKEAASGVRMV